MRKIELLSTLVGDVAPKIASDPLAKNAAPVNNVVPRNVRRVTLAFSFESEDFSCMSVQRTSIKIAVNGMASLVARAPPQPARRGGGAPNRIVIQP